MLALIANRLTQLSSEQGLANWLDTDYVRDRYVRCWKQHGRVQVVVGVVMIAGWLIAHHVRAANTRDSTSVKDVIKDLAERCHFAACSSSATVA